MKKSRPAGKEKPTGKRKELEPTRTLLSYIALNILNAHHDPSQRTVATLYLSPMQGGVGGLRPYQLQKEAETDQKQRKPLSLYLQEQAGKVYQEALARALKGCQAEDPAPLARAFKLFGPLLLEEHEILRKITEWWLAAQQGEERPQKNLQKKNLQKVLCSLRWAGSGRHKKLSPDKERDIALACLRWLPKFHKLSKDLRELQDHPAWQQASSEKRETMINRLARKHAVSVKEVQTIRRYFTGTRTRSRWVTPEKATFELVAEKFSSSPGTVEKIYRDFSRDYPHLRRDKEGNLPP